MSKYKVVIEGAYGERNFGDDALLRVIFNFIRKSYNENEILIRTKSKPLDYSMEQFSGNSDVKTIDQTRSLEVRNIVYGGGTQFFCFNKSDSFIFRMKLLIKHPYLLFSYLKRRLFKYSLIGNKHYIGIGLGPFENVNDFSFLKDKFKDATSFFVRDNISEMYANKIGVNKVKKYTDICFAEVIEGKNKNKNQNKNKKIAVILRDWDHSDFNFTVDNTDKYLRGINNVDIEYVILGNDVELVNRLNDRGIKYTCYNPDIISFDEFIIYLSSFDLIVTSRYHGVVYSILLDIPFIVLSIEPKLEIAGNELGAISIIAENDLKNITEVISHIDFPQEIEKVKTTRLEQNIIALEMLNEMANNLK